MERNLPKSRLAPLMMVAAALALPVLYVLAYLQWGAQPMLVLPSDNPPTTRVFSANWQTVAFVPAAIVEAKLTGSCVSLGAREPRNGSIRFVSTFYP